MLLKAERSAQAVKAPAAKNILNQEALAAWSPGGRAEAQAQLAEWSSITARLAEAGTGQQLALHTEGCVLTEAQALMVIVPDRSR